MRDVDKGHAWICFIGALGAQFFNGLSYGGGIIHVALLDYFKEDVAKTALVGSVFSNLVALLGPLGSIAINLTSCRVSMLIGSSLITIGFVSSYLAPNLDVLLFTYGITAGMGFGFTATTSVVIIGYAFEKYRGVAIGISVAATGIGMFACGPLFQSLIDNYTIRGAFLIIGGITANFFVFGALMKPSGLEEWHKQTIAKRKEQTGENSILKQFLHFEIFKNISFMFVLLSSVFTGLPYSLILMHLPNYSVTQGMTHDEAAFLLALVGLGSTVNRLLVGLASGEGGIDVLLLYFGSIAICGVFTVLFPLFSSSYVGQSIYALVFGLYSGAFCALLNPLCLDIVGLEQLPTAVGLFFCFLGTGGLIGPPIAGIIVDSGGTYEHSFYFAGTCFLLSATFVLISAIKRPKITSTNLSKNCNMTYSIDEDTVHPETFFPKGSGFLKGSGIFRGSGFMTAPEIFTGSGSFQGSSFINHLQSDSVESPKDIQILEIVPLGVES